jgi:hypothetical protein
VRKSEFLVQTSRLYDSLATCADKDPLGLCFCSPGNWIGNKFFDGQFRHKKMLALLKRHTLISGIASADFDPCGGAMPRASEQAVSGRNI